MKPLAAARWVLLIPVAIAAWYAVAFVGAMVYRPIEQALCPPGDWISGGCRNEDVALAMEVVMNFFIGLSALVVGVSSVVIAPAWRRRVAWIVFSVGACIAIAFGFALRTDYGMGLVESHWDYVASAVGAGLAGVLAIDHLLRRNRSNANPVPPSG